MNQTIESKLRTALETIQVLNPITVRLILNENAGQAIEEELKTFFRGSNNTSLQEIDLQFYRIMKSQSKIVIPSMEQSHLLSGLEIKNASAIFLPINTDYGYYGCFWACFRENDYSEALVETFSNFNEWITDVLWNAQRSDFGVEAIAQRYADFLDQLKTPALIVIYPDQVSISNPSFEMMRTKEKVIQMIRKGIASDSSFMELIELYQCTIREISFPGGKTGKIFQFNATVEKDPAISFNTNEFEYIALMVQKASGNLNLLDTAGNLNLMQFNYKEKVDVQLERLKTLVQYGKKHYRNFMNSREGAFEIVSIGDLLKEVVFDLKTVAKKKKLDIAYDVEKINGSPTQSGNVIGDAWLLTLAVFNLLENAIRYSKPDSKPIHVTLAYGADNWKLTIQDFGIGISPLDVEKILGKQSHTKEQQAVHGLDFVKYVVKLHKGTLDLESRLGKGSTFTLEIPYY